MVKRETAFSQRETSEANWRGQSQKGAPSALHLRNQCNLWSTSFLQSHARDQGVRLCERPSEKGLDACKLHPHNKRFIFTPGSMMSNVASSPLILRAAEPGDLPQVGALLAPFVARGDLLPRSADELALLQNHAWVVEAGGRIVGFAALEVYSRKMSELQCLSYEEGGQQTEIVRRLARRCVEEARELLIWEIMAVAPVELQPTLEECGFGFALPDQKRAMFIRPAAAPAAGLPDVISGPAGDVAFRRATSRDLKAVREFTAPFVARGELLPRTNDEFSLLLRHAFLGESAERMVAFAALEIYSKKLSEVQCLSVREGYRGYGLGRRLVLRCVELAREHHVAETMAISAHDEFFVACGFDYCLPHSKMALFIRSRDQ